MAKWTVLGPYFMRDGKTWCARCGRLPLTLDHENRTSYCRRCDSGELPDLIPVPVFMNGPEIMCGRCQVNAMTATGPESSLECPRCDLAPWQRDEALAPNHRQLAMFQRLEVAKREGRLDDAVRPPRPDNVVRACFYCLQTADHEWTWEAPRWRAICTACGNKLARSRENISRRKQSKGTEQ